MRVNEIFCWFCKITASCAWESTSHFTVLLWHLPGEVKQTTCKISSRELWSALLFYFSSLKGNKWAYEITMQLVFFSFLTLSYNSMADTWTWEMETTLCHVCRCWDTRKTEWMTLVLSGSCDNVYCEVQIFLQGYSNVGHHMGFFSFCYLRNL